jgi:CubicO group peptidase (beta-lactamase class C family)
MSKLTVHHGKTDAAPEEVGFRSEKLEVLDEHLARLIMRQKLQCAGYLLAREGRVFAWRTFGPRTGFDESCGDFMPDSIRRTASITKLFTATAVMQLIEQGLLRLDQPIATIIPEFDTNLHRDIQIFHLLTHTSGLDPQPGYFMEPLPIGSWDVRHRFDDWIQAALAGVPRNKPGKEWIYSNSGFSLLGEIIARLSGMSYYTYVTTRILEPLGMTRSFFNVPNSLKNETIAVYDWELQRKDPDVTDTSEPPQAAGGLYSTLHDLWKMGQMLLNGGELNGVRILSAKAVARMTQNHLHGVPAYHWGKELRDHPYGLGMNVFNGIGELMSPGTFSHEGVGRSALYMDPAERLAVAFFVPTKLDWVAESLPHTRNIIWSGIV